MTTTLTLKNIPDAVYERLKQSAESNRRSMNSEAIVCLEAALLTPAPNAALHLAHARAVRGSLSGRRFRAADIDAYKRQGRR